MLAWYAYRPNAKWVITVFTAVGAGLGGMVLHAAVTWLGMDWLESMPFSISTDGRAADLLSKYGPAGVMVTARPDGGSGGCVGVVAGVGWVVGA